MNIKEKVNGFKEVLIDIGIRPAIELTNTLIEDVLESLPAEEVNKDRFAYQSFDNQLVHIQLRLSEYEKAKNNNTVEPNELKIAINEIRLSYIALLDDMANYKPIITTVSPAPKKEHQTLTATYLPGILGLLFTAIILVPIWYLLDDQDFFYRIIFSFGVAGIVSLLPYFFDIPCRKRVRIGYAIAAFLLTFYFTPNIVAMITGASENTFDLTVKFIESDKTNSYPAPENGRLLLHLDKITACEKLDESGGNHFQGLSEDYFNKVVKVGFTKDEFWKLEKDSLKLDSQYQEVKLIPSGILQKINGVIVDENNDPMAGATLFLLEINDSTTTNANGEFSFDLEVENQRKEHSLNITKDNYQPANPKIHYEKFRELAPIQLQKIKAGNVPNNARTNANPPPPVADLKKKKREKEKKACNAAKASSNKIEKYKAYLKNYPTGDCAEEFKQFIREKEQETARLEALRKAEQAKLTACQKSGMTVIKGDASKGIASFAIDNQSVTQKEFLAFMNDAVQGQNPAQFFKKITPVSLTLHKQFKFNNNQFELVNAASSNNKIGYITWKGAREYLAWKNRKSTSRTYYLPTENLLRHLFSTGKLLGYANSSEWIGSSFSTINGRIIKSQKYTNRGGVFIDSDLSFRTICLCD